MAEPTPQLERLRNALLTPRNLKLLALAFGAGLLLFLLLWLDQRNDTDFFKASAPGAQSSDDAGLPTPLPADVANDDQNASGLTLPPAGARPSASDSQLPHIIEPATPVAAPMPPPATPYPSMPGMTGNSGTPTPVSRTPPNYPREALQRGVGGTVRVQATVSADGSVERMELAESSGNRFLDRAAMEAVRRWRFEPAMRNGQPVSATVTIPIEFNPNH